jgi:hypothetical protein
MKNEGSTTEAHWGLDVNHKSSTQIVKMQLEVGQIHLRQEWKRNLHRRSGVELHDFLTGVDLLATVFVQPIEQL